MLFFSADRAEGNGEIYAYLMHHPNNIDVLIDIPQRSKQNFGLWIFDRAMVFQVLS